MTRKNFSIIIYLLSAILVLILSIFIYRVITQISYSNPQNEVIISKYTGERIHDVYSVKPAKIATYINANNKPSSKGLSSADVVFEFLSTTYGITYKAIFNKESAENLNTSINLKEYTNSYLPKLNFVDSIETSEINSKDATSIFITFNEDSSSNFLYQDGEYYHYKDLCIDKDNDIPVKLSNVIVQFIHGNILSDETLATSQNNGIGLLFSGGKAQNIKWTRKKDSQIILSDQNGDPISLLSGPTWWIFIDKDCSVAYD